MSVRPQPRTLLDEVLEAPREQRALIRAELREPTEPLEQQAVDDAWKEELIHRVRSLKDGSAELLDWEDVKRELDEMLAE